MVFASAPNMETAKPAGLRGACDRSGVSQKRGAIVLAALGVLRDSEKSVTRKDVVRAEGSLPEDCTTETRLSFKSELNFEWSVPSFSTAPCVEEVIEMGIRTVYETVHLVATE